MSHWEDPLDIFLANTWEKYSTTILYFVILFFLAHIVFWFIMERKINRTKSIYDFSNQLEEY